MNELWAIRLRPQDAFSAAILRTSGGVEVCAQEAALWLRGPRDGGVVERLVARLPGERFSITPQGLVPWGSLLPVQAAPGGPWQTAASYFAPLMPTASLPGMLDETLPLTLSRTGIEEPAALLLLAWQTWHEFVEEAPLLRLRALRFACTKGGRTLVRGTPLPPIPGTLLTLGSGLAIPCGLAWSPQVTNATVAARLDIPEGGIALLASDGSYEIVPASAWGDATRSAVRLAEAAR